MSEKNAASIPTERIERAILLIRGYKVILDADLAFLYEVSTGNLNKAVSRNRTRFPADFMFQLTSNESAELLSFQTGISKPGRGGRRYRPYAFTEQGVAMLSTVLRSERAIQVNIAIMRAFVQLRQLLSSHAALARKLSDLERRYDRRFQVVFEAIRKLMAPKPSVQKRRIGFCIRGTPINSRGAMDDHSFRH